MGIAAMIVGNNLSGMLQDVFSCWRAVVLDSSNQASSGAVGFGYCGNPAICTGQLDNDRQAVSSG
ncbi:uncharacterized protein ASPGLDRAFT_1446187 [Aspergillus glaucus CBS 516.65]|uniref:Uncharacterized protein n=1 Tax=Aspergillus glaucus CBS 516.65 TaxID=1160497 RepID=A0A1L9VKP9_ASPGL|nr:hypothetical protein ASPGLDRAFT_1446187 [Aspergillus glaucus CBS 516.65]OJJ84471.1 hypothetical protein ASPGLDRAFT_1446187 [Aspergillus glaucus CBS 516.65]